VVERSDEGEKGLELESGQGVCFGGLTTAGGSSTKGCCRPASTGLGKERRAGEKKRDQQSELPGARCIYWLRRSYAGVAASEIGSSSSRYLGSHKLPDRQIRCLERL
jgi:hypothetical protein